MALHSYGPIQSWRVKSRNENSYKMRQPQTHLSLYQVPCLQCRTFSASLEERRCGFRRALASARCRTDARGKRTASMGHI